MVAWNVKDLIPKASNVSATYQTHELLPNELSGAKIAEEVKRYSETRNKNMAKAPKIKLACSPWALPAVSARKNTEHLASISTTRR